MKLYLVQHAQANSEQDDPSRGLSEQGLSDIGKIARKAESLRINVSRIFHSGKKRAQQTAETLAGSLNPAGGGVSFTEGLAPMDDPGIWAECLSTYEGDIALVGHLPHLGKLAGLLLCGNEENKAVSFTNAGIVCFNRNDDVSWSLEWTLTPWQI